MEPSDATDELDFMKPNVDVVANPYLSAQAFVFALIGLFFFDAYFGLSYLAQIFVRKEMVAPTDLYQDAFARILPLSSTTHISEDHKNSLGGEMMMELLGRSTGRSMYTATSLSRRR